MIGSYEVLQRGKPCGTVRVQRQGLYYHFSCRCNLSGDVIHKLAVSCGGKQESLGVCVPMDGCFGIEKKIPVKRLGEGIPEFQLLPRHEKQTGKFVPIYPEEPFSYMTRLKDAFLVRQAGEIGILLQE